jgi:hypothetical protein
LGEGSTLEQHDLRLANHIFSKPISSYLNSCRLKLQHVFGGGTIQPIALKSSL